MLPCLHPHLDQSTLTKASCVPFCLAHPTPSHSVVKFAIMNIRDGKIPRFVSVHPHEHRLKVSLDEEEIHLPVTYRSGVWGHFGFTKRDGQLEKTNAICKMCHAASKHTGSTTNLTSYLKRRHGVNVTERSPSAPVVSTSGDAAANMMTGERSSLIPTFFHAPQASNSVHSTKKNGCHRVLYLKRHPALQSDLELLAEVMIPVLKCFVIYHTCSQEEQHCFRLGLSCPSCNVKQTVEMESNLFNCTAVCTTFAFIQQLGTAKSHHCFEFRELSHCPS